MILAVATLLILSITELLESVLNQFVSMEKDGIGSKLNVFAIKDFNIIEHHLNVKRFAHKDLHIIVHQKIVKNVQRFQNVEKICL